MKKPTDSNNRVTMVLLTDITIAEEGVLGHGAKFVISIPHDRFKVE